MCVGDPFSAQDQRGSLQVSLPSRKMCFPWPLYFLLESCRRAPGEEEEEEEEEKGGGTVILVPCVCVCVCVFFLFFCTMALVIFA